MKCRVGNEILTALAIWVIDLKNCTKNIHSVRPRRFDTRLGEVVSANFHLWN